MIQEYSSILSDIDLPGHNNEQTPTESSAGGTLIYISQNLSHKHRQILQIYCSIELESVFIELLIPNKKNTLLEFFMNTPL